MVAIPKKPQGVPAGYPAPLPSRDVRKRFLRLLGPFEKASVPLALKVTEEKRLPGNVVRQRVVYRVSPEETVPAYHLFLKDLPANAPGVLSIHAHGGDQIFPVGKAYHCKPDPADPGQYSYRAAIAGFRVLAPDALCFGERQNTMGFSRNFFFEIDRHAELCGRGSSLAWKSVWDNSRAVEALESLGARSIGAIGASGGSTQSYILAAVNPKIKAAACLFSFLTLRNQFYQHRVCHCLYHYIPGMMAAGLDWDQVAALTAPRKLLLGWGDKDEGTPEVMYRAFLNAIRKRCREEGLPASVETYAEKGCPHKVTEPMLQASLKFLAKHLGK